jgi:hypothetical protein
MVRAMTRVVAPIQRERQNQLQAVLQSGCVKISAEISGGEIREGSGAVNVALNIDEKISAEIFSSQEASADSFAELVEHVRAGAPEVDVKTCVPHWLGKRCDYGMAVDG